MTLLSHSQPANDVGLDLDALEEIQRRVLWLAVRMVDHANNDRPSGEVKVGGHQASSASIVGIMTSLWFGHLGPDDKVAAKPHASPVLHSLNYLIGALDGSYLTRLRELGGLQAYPSRTKDPDVHDFSLGSVGLGVVAPLFAAAARRYVNAHFGAPRERPPRFIALAGDAELDEGNVWEAIADPALQGLGNVMWVIDTNRQSLDRVVPDQKIKKLMNHFAAAGWHVVEAKYGSKLQAAFEKPGGDELRRHVDGMSNEQYQSLFGLTGPELRERFLLGASTTLAALVDEYGDDDLAPLVQDLAGHDLAELIRCYRRCDEVTDRPSVVFAYTVKGWGLPVAGDPLNHAALVATRRHRRPPTVTGAHARIGVGPLRTRHECRIAVLRRRAAPATTRSDGAAGGERPDLRPRIVSVVEACQLAGGVRAAAAAVGGRARRPVAARHDLPRRQRQHEPRRLDQQGRRVPSRRATRLPR